MMKNVDFYGHAISRLILGDNPFTGHSYIEHIHSGSEMLDYYTADQCVRALFEAEKQGLNVFMALGDPFIIRVIRQYKNEGGRMHIMFQSYPAIDLPVNLRMMLQCEPIAIYHQGSTADLYTETGETHVLKERIKMIKETGVLAGMGTHVPNTVIQADQEDWGADFYVTCLYNARKTQRGQQSGFVTGKSKKLVFYPDDRFEMFEAVQKVKKPCIVFKVFAGGQVFEGQRQEDKKDTARQYLKETYDHIKPNDVVMIGAFQKYRNEIKENADLVKSILAE